jgi:hypothetical protein
MLHLNFERSRGFENEPISEKKKSRGRTFTFNVPNAAIFS